MRIAIVDDDRLWTDLLTLVLHSQGYDTTVVHDSQQAYGTIKAQQPALVLQDLRMEHPDSGWRVLAQLQSDPATVQIPVIMMSAERDIEQQARHRGLDQVAVFAKSGDLDVLLEWVTQLVQDCLD